MNGKNENIEPAPPNSCEDQLKECQKQSDEYLAGWQRAKADFLNYRKEEQNRMRAILDFQKAQLIVAILKVFDNIERAREYLPADLIANEWTQGILQINAQFNGFLKEQGIELIKTENEKFNPNFHEAMGQVEIDGRETGDIAEVVENGYMLNNVVIRPTKVKVVK